MTLLLVPWLLLAPLFLILRRASWLQSAPDGGTYGPDDAEGSDNVAVSVPISLAAINHACEQAGLAHAAGCGETATRLLRGAHDAIAVLCHDLGRQIATWGATTWRLDAATDVPPLSPGRVRTPWIRIAARGEFWCRFVLAGNLGRLRLHLFVLRWTLALLLRRFRRLPRRPARGVSNGLAAVLSDLHVVVDATLLARAALADSADLCVGHPQVVASTSH